MVGKELGVPWTLKHDLMTLSDRLTFDCFRSLLMLLAEEWKQEEVHKQAMVQLFSGKFCRIWRTKYLFFLSFNFRSGAENVSTYLNRTSSQWAPSKWKASVAVENIPVGKKTLRLVYSNFVLPNKPQSYCFDWILELLSVFKIKIKFLWTFPISNAYLFIGSL